MAGAAPTGGVDCADKTVAGDGVRSSPLTNLPRAAIVTLGIECAPTFPQYRSEGEYTVFCEPRGRNPCRVRPGPPAADAREANLLVSGRRGPVRQAAGGAEAFCALSFCLPRARIFLCYVFWGNDSEFRNLIFFSTNLCITFARIFLQILAEKKLGFLNSQSFSRKSCSCLGSCKTHCRRT